VSVNRDPVRDTFAPDAAQTELSSWSSSMPVPAILLTQFFVALIGYGFVARWYVVPALAGRPLKTALPPLLLPHLVRPVSLWLLAPGVVVQHGIPRTFAEGTAYGDLIATALALIAVVLVRAEARWGVAAAWIFNVVGLLDALRNCLVGMMLEAPPHMGAAVFIPAFGVPLLLVSHFLIFKILIDQRRSRLRVTETSSRAPSHT